jgi:hypothetical protein
MRKVTRQEADEWMALARDYGFTNEAGGVLLGRFITEPGEEEGTIRIRFITPVPAGLFTHGDLKKKTPPILFDRTPAGEIIIPSRWWASMLEKLAGTSDLPESIGLTALGASRHLGISDVYLPADTDTISISAPGHDGEPVSTEALTPGCSCLIHLRQKEG